MFSQDQVSIEPYTEITIKVSKQNWKCDQNFVEPYIKLMCLKIS